MTLRAAQGPVCRRQGRWLVVFAFLLLFLLLFFIVIFVVLVLLFFLLLLDRCSPPPLFALLGAVVVTSSVMVALQAGRRGKLVKVLRGREGAYEDGAQNPIKAEVSNCEQQKQIWPTMQLFLGPERKITGLGKAAACQN